ncbi:hypothetical protein Tco_0714241 [Tanacetum coccineum]
MIAKILENYNQQLILEYSLVMHLAGKGIKSVTKEPDVYKETNHSVNPELTEQMAPVQLSTGPAPTFLTPGQISSGLVPNPVPDSSLCNLLVLKDRYLPLQQFKFQSTQPVHLHLLPLIKMHLLQVIATVPSLSYNLQGTQGIAAESPLMDDNPFAPIDNDNFIKRFAPEPRSEASSSRGY